MKQLPKVIGRFMVSPHKYSEHWSDQALMPPIILPEACHRPVFLRHSLLSVQGKGKNYSRYVNEEWVIEDEERVCACVNIRMQHTPVRIQGCERK